METTDLIKRNDKILNHYLKTGDSLKTLSKKFEVSETTIFYIISSFTTSNFKGNDLNYIPDKKYSDHEKTEQELLEFSGYKLEDVIKEL